MQTFLPYPNFACSAMVLDRNRLGCQRKECRQILQAIVHGGGWRNHPVARMWRNHVPALKLYHDVVCREWMRRGYVNNLELFLPPPESVVMPDWLGGEDFHARHRAALLHKDPRHYTQFGWEETPALDYIYPAD